MKHESIVDVYCMHQWQSRICWFFVTELTRKNVFENVIVFFRDSCCFEIKLCTWKCCCFVFHNSCCFVSVTVNVVVLFLAIHCVFESITVTVNICCFVFRDWCVLKWMSEMKFLIVFFFAIEVFWNEQVKL